MTRLAVTGVLSLILLTGCGSGSDSSSGGEIMVFAAASLKGAFTEIGAQFKADNPGTSVEFSFAGSSDLVTQLTQGARASATEKVEQATGVTVAPVSEEASVTDVLNKVTSGQADAGLVYVTDAKGAGDKITAVPFPEAAQAVNTYPIAVLMESENRDLAREFVDLVTAEAGQQVLARSGFAKP
jgi:ABC-type molybdate transport system substrate-binding protein